MLPTSVPRRSGPDDCRYTQIAPARSSSDPFACTRGTSDSDRVSGCSIDAERGWSALDTRPDAASGRIAERLSWELPSPLLKRSRSDRRGRLSGVTQNRRKRVYAQGYGRTCKYMYRESSGLGPSKFPVRFRLWKPEHYSSSMHKASPFCRKAATSTIQVFLALPGLVSSGRSEKMKGGRSWRRKVSARRFASMTRQRTG